MVVDKEVNPRFESTFKVYKQRVSQQFKGKRFTQEHKDKISAALKGRKRVVT